MGRPDRWYLRPFSQAIENEERDHAAGGREVEEEDVMDAAAAAPGRSPEIPTPMFDSGRSLSTLTTRPEQPENKKQVQVVFQDVNAKKSETEAARSYKEEDNYDDGYAAPPPYEAPPPYKAPPYRGGREVVEKEEGSRRQRCCTGRMWTCCLLGTVMVILGLGLGIYFGVFSNKGPDNHVASCGSCFCIPDNSTGNTCPAADPVTNYSSVTVQTLASQTPLNAYNLTCNPYTTSSCTTLPAQNRTLVALNDTAVCGIHYESQFASDATCRDATYMLQSYPSRTAAVTAGAFVTHVGACGVCSTTQDLAVYLEHSDLSSLAKLCASQAAVHLSVGVECFVRAGFTQPCATIWAYDVLNTAQKCFQRCTAHMAAPPNGPAPTCALNDCIVCDQEESGALFDQYAGRTRSRSGVLSALVLPCSQFTNLTQQECPTTTALTFK